MQEVTGYEKTAGSWRGLLFGGNVWLGSDHVLVVRNMRFSEEYTRYYYRDIQALQIRRAPRYWAPSWIFGILVAAALAGLIGAIRTQPLVTWLSALVLMGLTALVMFRTFALGCVCHVVTAIATDEIRPLRQIGAAREVMASVSQRVQAVQGEIAVHRASELRDALDRRSEEASARRGPAASFDAAEDMGRHGQVLGVSATAVAIASTLTDGIITFAQMRHWAVPAWVGMGNVLAGVLAGVVSVVILRQSRRLRWLRNIALAGALFVGGMSYLLFTLANAERALPANARGALEVILRFLGGANLFGDGCFVAAALVLAVRFASRSRVGRARTESV